MSPRIFVFEFVAGGGWRCRYRERAPAGLLCEGRAMLSALVDDLVTAGFSVSSSIDAELAVPANGARWIAIESTARLEQVFDSEAATADSTIVIAPEFDGLLLDWCARARAAGGHVLACSHATLALCADKHLTAELLQAHGVPAAVGVLLPGDVTDFPFPAVLKPVDGAGSCDVQWVKSAQDVTQRIQRSKQRWRLERFQPGIAASVSFLCGPRQIVALPAASQVLGADALQPGSANRFAYLGGQLPLPDDLARRATRLATAAICALDEPLGWLGVDLVLGHSPDGSEDAVIEINPRLTTSYVGLRALSRDHLASAMVGVARGTSVDLRFSDQPVRFDPAGNVTLVQIEAGV